MSSHLKRLVALTAALIAVAPAASPAGAQVGADYIASENVTLLKSIKPAGDGVGARVVGNYLYVTSTKDLQIYDISKPEDPQMVGSLTVHIEFENEEVPTNGKVLAISGQTPTVTGAGNICPSTYPVASSSGCLVIYDVRDKENPKEVSTVLDAGDHTSTCVLDCQYFYGSTGSVTDARGVLDGKPAQKIGNWQDSATIPDFNGDDDGKFVDSCHNVHPIRPGILMAACQPFLILSVRPEDGGSVLQPKVLATGSNEDGRFIHGNTWPREGADKIALAGGETNFQQRCHDETGAFMTWDASHANLDGRFSGPLDEYRAQNGSYLDTNPPVQVLGCSVHWFEEHPTFHDGGLVALATYENGTRFLQIGADGKITEQGYFVPLGGSTSAPHWAPGGSDVVYAVDYERGLDVLKYTGPHYVPGQSENDRTPGTGGEGPKPSSGPAACKASAGFLKAAAKPSGKGLRLVVSRRAKRKFEVAVVQQARGRKLLKNRDVARFRGRTSSFQWDGKGAANGWYVVRFRMPLGNGKSDVRRISLRRSHGRFVRRPASHIRDTCGPLNSFKLQRPVFGGVGSRPLKISYSLPRGVDRVSVVATARGKVLKRFKRTGADAGREYRFQLPAKGIRRGTDVQVRVTVVRAGTRTSSVLVSRRI